MPRSKKKRSKHKQQTSQKGGNKSTNFQKQCIDTPDKALTTKDTEKQSPKDAIVNEDYGERLRGSPADKPGSRSSSQVYVVEVKKSRKRSKTSRSGAWLVEHTGLESETESSDNLLSKICTPKRKKIVGENEDEVIEKKKKKSTDRRQKCEVKDDHMEAEPITVTAIDGEREKTKKKKDKKVKKKGEKDEDKSEVEQDEDKTEEDSECLPTSSVGTNSDRVTETDSSEVFGEDDSHHPDSLHSSIGKQLNKDIPLRDR